MTRNTQQSSDTARAKSAVLPAGIPGAGVCQSSDMVERVVTRAEELLRYGDPHEQADIVAAFLDQEGWLTYAEIVRRLGRAAAFSWGTAEMYRTEREASHHAEAWALLREARAYVDLSLANAIDALFAKLGEAR